jgi:predicted metal-dependent phosphoesterase TrpH
MAFVDLHLHTTASDGQLTPAQLIGLVARQGLQIVSVTDHDSTEGLDEAIQAAKHFPSLTVIPGIELSTDIPGTEIHILGYFLDYQDSRFQKTLVDFRLGREERGWLMVQKLKQLDIKIEWGRVKELSGGGAIGRPHLAQAMLERGYVSSQKDAFDLYIGRNGPAYVERSKLSPADAVGFINSVGGVGVLAHPTFVSNSERVVGDLKKVGLAGIEVYYKDYSPEDVRKLSSLATRYDLVPCGGSDYHALGIPGEVLPGIVGPPLETIEKLKALTKRVV